MRRVNTVMTIAGSDSSGGAGIQADLKTFAALGVYGTSVITAITAQNSQGVNKVLAIPPDMVSDQIDAIMKDIGSDSVKTGMMSNSAVIEAVAEKLKEYSLKNVVVDPVMNAKGGEELLRKSAVEPLKEKLIPLSLVITPNLPEAEVLTGCHLDSETDIRKAAKKIYELGAKYVLIKGGHRSGDAIDVLYDGRRFREFIFPRVETSKAHGTGCTFASAIAAWLAKGVEVERAIEESKVYITSALKNAFPVGKGYSPVHHFYHFWQDSTTSTI